MMGSKAFESPLISHARMRGMYRALVETRVLSERLKRGAAGRFKKGLEACWVGTAIGLREGDLTSEPAGRALIDHVLRTGLGEAATPGEVRKTVRAMAAEQNHFAGSAGERLVCAVGQAMALKAQAGKRVVVAYVGQDEVTAAEWKRLFTVAASDLPLIVVSMPGAGKIVDVSAAAKAVGANVPVIPVDAGDVVAMYRVAQESIGRARSEGGLVVIECVAMGTDPIKLLGSQLVKKKICTEAWVARVDASFRRMVASV